MTNLQVAETIREQIGGAKFAAMTGARNFTGTPNSLTFQIGRFAALKVCYVSVTLEANDLYTMKFYNSKAEVIAEREMINADALRTVFTSVTGLDTRI